MISGETASFSVAAVNPPSAVVQLLEQNNFKVTQTDASHQDEFKEQLDKILKDLNILKSDLDYFLYVEKESTKDNKAKEKSFHEFDNRLAKVLGI